MRIAIIAPPYPLEEIPSPPLGVTYVAAAFEAAGAEAKYSINCFQLHQRKSKKTIGIFSA